jgi:hypothetical protein
MIFLSYLTFLCCLWSSCYRYLSCYLSCSFFLSSLLFLSLVLSPSELVPLFFLCLFLAFLGSFLVCIFLSSFIIHLLSIERQSYMGNGHTIILRTYDLLFDRISLNPLQTIVLLHFQLLSTFLLRFIFFFMNIGIKKLKKMNLFLNSFSIHLYDRLIVSTRKRFWLLFLLQLTV